MKRAPGRRAERREEILASMMEVLERLLADGTRYSELSVERLAKEAGTSRSRFYVYFEDKADLLRALTADVIADLFDATLDWWSLPAGSSEEDVLAVTRRIIDVYLEHERVMGAVLEVAAHDSAMREFFSSLFFQALEGYAARVAEAQADGRADPALDPPRTVALLSWMTQSGLYHVVAGAAETAVDRWARSLSHIVWNTLYAPAS
jgi:TetR/AcrR family transcriptional regulator, ethionamide resistance regulator